MARRPAIMLYKGDWKRDPQLSMCSPATRGIWIDLVCDMDDLRSATLRGTAQMLARMCRASAEELVAALRELRDAGAADVTEDGATYTVTSRRVARDLATSDARTDAVQNRYKTPTKPLQTCVQNAESEIEIEDAVVVASEKTLKCDAAAIYEAYPRRVGKGGALKAIEAAFRRLCHGESPAVAPEAADGFLMAAVVAFARSPSGNAGRFTPHPKTWFGNSRYLDDQRYWDDSAGPGPPTQATVGMGMRMGMTPEDAEYFRNRAAEKASKAELVESEERAG